VGQDRKEGERRTGQKIGRKKQERAKTLIDFGMEASKDRKARGRVLEKRGGGGRMAEGTHLN